MTIIYTDGSALKSGKGGFGVVVCEGKPNQEPEDYKLIAAYSERAEATTNNRMEMSSVLYALKVYGAAADDFTCPIVYSDSMYTINSFTTWIKSWRRNGWTRYGGGTLENLDLIQEYDDLTERQGRSIELRYVKGHNGHKWNELADDLATARVSPEEAMERG
jgi:ribonuclease HI